MNERLNVAVLPENKDFIRFLAKVSGQTEQNVVNAIIDESRFAFRDLLTMRQSLIAKLNIGLQVQTESERLDEDQPEEVDGTTTDAEVAADNVGNEPQADAPKKKKYYKGYTRRHRWTAEEDAWIAEHGDSVPIEDVARIFGVTISAARTRLWTVLVKRGGEE